METCMGHVVGAPKRARSGRCWILFVLVVAACGDSGGTLTISLDAYPKITNVPSVPLSGVVSRTPARNTQITVSATVGSSTTSAVADARGVFHLTVPLTLNGINQIGLTATDDGGATSQQVVIGIQQDGVAPAIAQATPNDQSDSVALTTPIRVTLSKRVSYPVAGGFQFTRQGTLLPESVTVSAHSLTYTFTPSGLLSPNAIYRIAFQRAADSAGNTLAGTPWCV